VSRKPDWRILGVGAGGGGDEGRSGVDSGLGGQSENVSVSGVGRDFLVGEGNRGWNVESEEDLERWQQPLRRNYAIGIQRGDGEEQRRKAGHENLHPLVDSFTHRLVTLILMEVVSTPLRLWPFAPSR